jgi:predicted nucleic acid-binding Zn ribbon protein
MLAQPERNVPAEPARVLSVGYGIDSAQAACLACGALLRPRRRACSGKCRAALSRERRAETQAKRNQEIRAHLRGSLAVA